MYFIFLFATRIRNFKALRGAAQHLKMYENTEIINNGYGKNVIQGNKPYHPKRGLFLLS